MDDRIIVTAIGEGMAHHRQLCSQRKAFAFQQPIRCEKRDEQIHSVDLVRPRVGCNCGLSASSQTIAETSVRRSCFRFG